MQLNQMKPFQRVIVTGHPVYDTRVGEIGLDVDRHGAQFVRFDSASQITSGAYIEPEFLRKAA